VISEEKRAELLWAQIEAGRAFIASQVRARFYLVGVTLAIAFLLLLPPGVPPNMLQAVARQYHINDLPAPEGLLSTLIWFIWLTVVLQTCSRSLVVAREASHLRAIEARFVPLAGVLVTRYTDFAGLRLAFLRTVELAFMGTYFAVTALVGGYRLWVEWQQTGWHPVFATFNSLAFAGSLVLIALALRDFKRL
jgi:hypothetical protein